MFGDCFDPASHIWLQQLCSHPIDFQSSTPCLLAALPTLHSTGTRTPRTSDTRHGINLVGAGVSIALSQFCGEFADLCLS